MTIHLLDKGRAVNPRVHQFIARMHGHVAGLVQVMRQIGAVVLFIAKLTALAGLLGFFSVIALGGFTLSIMPDHILAGHGHGGALNLHVVTALRSIFTTALLLGVLGSIWGYKKIAAVSRANRPLANLLGGVGFGLFAALFDWMVLSDPDFYHGDNGPLWCVVGGSGGAAVWLFSAVQKLRRPEIGG